MVMKHAEELEGYRRSEESSLVALIKGMADSSARVVAAGSCDEKRGMIALHALSEGAGG